MAFVGAPFASLPRLWGTLHAHRPPLAHLGSQHGTGRGARRQRARGRGHGSGFEVRTFLCARASGDPSRDKDCSCDPPCVEAKGTPAGDAAVGGQVRRGAASMREVVASRMAAAQMGRELHHVFQWRASFNADVRSVVRSGNSVERVLRRTTPLRPNSDRFQTEICRQSSTNVGPMPASSGPNSAKFQPRRLDLDRCFAKYDHDLAGSGRPSWAFFDQLWADFDRHRANPGRCQVRPNLGQCRPTLAGLGQIWASIGRMRLLFGQLCLNSSKLVPEIGELRRICGPNLIGRLGPPGAEGEWTGKSHARRRANSSEGTSARGARTGNAQRGRLVGCGRCFAR